MRTRHVAGQLQGAFQGLALNPKAKRSRTSMVRTPHEAPPLQPHMLQHGLAWPENRVVTLWSGYRHGRCLQIAEVLGLGVQPYSGSEGRCCVTLHPPP